VLFFTLVIGALPFCALGLAIGYVAGPNSAPAIVNVIYLPMSFASGLWIPIEYLPKFLQKIAPMLPPYHFAQLALAMIGVGKGSPLNRVIALISFTVSLDRDDRIPPRRRKGLRINHETNAARRTRRAVAGRDLRRCIG